MKNSASCFGPRAWPKMFYDLARFPLHVTPYSLHFLVLSNIDSVRPHIPFSHSGLKTDSTGSEGVPAFYLGVNGKC